MPVEWLRKIAGDNRFPVTFTIRSDTLKQLPRNFQEPPVVAPFGAMTWILPIRSWYSDCLRMQAAPKSGELARWPWLRPACREIPLLKPSGT